MAMVDKAGKCVEKYRYVHFTFPFHPLPLCVAQCSNPPLFFHAGMWAGCCACSAPSAGAWGGGMSLWHACWRGGRKRLTLIEMCLSTHRKRRSWCCGRATTAPATSATSGSLRLAGQWASGSFSVWRYADPTVEQSFGLAQLMARPIRIAGDARLPERAPTRPPTRTCPNLPASTARVARPVLVPVVMGTAAARPSGRV